MAYEVNGKVLEATENGYLVSQDDWNKDVAEAIAAAEGLTLTQDHWDVIEYLRDAYFNHNGEQPNNRAILKAMQDKWAGRKVDNKTLFDLLPGQPLQAGGQDRGAAGEPAQGRLLRRPTRSACAASAFRPLLHHAAANGVGRGELEAAVLRIEGLQEAALAIEDQLAEEDVTGELDDHVRTVARRVTRVDDDDAAIGELGLHAVAQHAQGVGFERAAAVLSAIASPSACVPRLSSEGFFL